ncbi:hypothetical protein VTN02DRAFT_4347 [Thermoascus thermophilus]
MSRLHIPGIPVIEDRASRFKRPGAVFRPVPRRVAFRENPEASARLEERRAARLARPRPWLPDNRSRPAKRVRFGEATVVTVDRWIERRAHVFPAPGRILGQLQGWKVTPLAAPDEDGETARYTTYWGSGSSMLSFSHHRPCDREGCAWNELAGIQRGWDGRTPGRFRHWSTADVFRVWLARRERVRRRGGSIGRRRVVLVSSSQQRRSLGGAMLRFEVSGRSLSSSTRTPVSPWHMALAGFP